MLKILCQVVIIIVETWKHIWSLTCKLSNGFKFQMLRHGIQFRAMYVESSVSQQYYTSLEGIQAC